MTKHKKREHVCKFCARPLTTDAEKSAGVCNRCQRQHGVSLEQMRGEPDPRYGRREGL